MNKYKHWIHIEELEEYRKEHSPNLTLEQYLQKYKIKMEEENMPVIIMDINNKYPHIKGTLKEF